MNEEIHYVTCGACGCVCEDVTVNIKDQCIVAVENACRLCEVRLMGQIANPAVTAEIGGQPVSTKAAIEQAASILSASHAPLIWGMAGSTIETQRAAVALADFLGATIDPCLPGFHRAAIQAMQTVGISTCTLGEVKQRADLIVFWGANPSITHPLLYKRFIDPPGLFSSERRVINIAPLANDARCDEFIPLEKQNNFIVLSVLRSLVSGNNVESADVGGVSLQQLQKLATRLQDANYSVIFFGSDIGDTAEIEALFLFVKQLNNTGSRSAAMAMGGTLCENVLNWQTGYPCGVNFSLGYPRYDPIAYSANSAIERGEADAVVIVGSERLDELSSTARARLSKIPIIAIENAGACCSLNAKVRMTTAIPGVHYGGTIFRMDGVPLRLRPIFASSLPTAASLLTALQNELQ